MKALFTFLFAALISAPLFAAEVAATPSADSLLPLDDNTPFQFCIMPGLPTSQVNSNVFGVKAGAPVSYGIGRVYGLEGSVLMSGTAIINGIQTSIVFCKSEIVWGLQATLGVAINTKGFEGLQAAPIFCYAGDYRGAQASAFNISGNAHGFQAAAIGNISGDVQGFQASVIANITKKFSGFQAAIYNDVDESKGIQFGLISRSKKGGLQFGLLNFIDDAAIPCLPIVNFKF